MKAIWKGKIIGESDKTIIIEGNQYFPHDSVNMEYLRSSETQTVCHWKGTASYYDVIVEGEVNSDAAWYYPSPLAAAENIKDYIAFWKSIEITE